MTSHQRVLIEDWLPVAELGIESRRERAASSALPPISYLHVWWARRPLVASAAVVLAGLLPTWSDEVQSAFPTVEAFASESAYRAWFRRLIGIWGDPIAAQAKKDAAEAAGARLKDNPFTYKQAYRNRPQDRDLLLLRSLLEHTWGAMPVVADPTAGGGSIPFTACRLGIPTMANDLNGVAASILVAGVEIPSKYGSDLIAPLRLWGTELVKRVSAETTKFFPAGRDETITRYIWANAVACPRTGRLVPLLTDLWLRKEKGREVAVSLVIDEDGEPLMEPRFDLLFASQVDPAAAARKIAVRGAAVSPYDDLVISSEYIKDEAQAGRMRQVLYAVAIKKPSGDDSFRAPTEVDLEAILGAEARLGELRPDWERGGILPTEDFPPGNDERPIAYGMAKWADFFSPRQLLLHGTFVDQFIKIRPEVVASLGEDVGNRVLFELALMQGKALNWNARLSSWNVNYQRMRSVFDSHNFAMKWTFAEMEGSRDIYGWALAQTLKAYGEIADMFGTGVADTLTDSRVAPGHVDVSQGSGADIRSWVDRSVAHVCIDPPYYDNVMYAELADFFYVWEKRTAGLIRPELFVTSLSDKENEAVANVARFEAMGKRKKELANVDYQAKMTAIFAECRRVLRDDGVLSVMFTHKRAEAWDTLGMGLLESGFTIETSWPVNTEFENSLHQANMNSAASTIMLVCRKRDADPSQAKTYLDDIEGEIRQAARDAATRFQADGIEGVDLLLSTYGPTLSIISSYWPVYSSTPDEFGRDRLLRPEETLDLAREEVVRLRRQRIVGRAAQIDGYTDFVLLAWDIFSAREFPFDTARLLAIAVGGHDVDDLERAKIIEKKSGVVRLLTPRERIRRDPDGDLPGVRPSATSFDSMIDAVDTVLYIGEVDGMSAAKAFMDKCGLTTDGRFHAAVQGLTNAIPRTKAKGEWVIPEAGLLNTVVTAFLTDYVSLPVDEVEPQVIEQGLLFGADGG